MKENNYISNQMFEIEFTTSALEDLLFLAKTKQKLIVSAIDQQLIKQPLIETRNRKYLRPNVLGAWELRIGKYRVFYDVDTGLNLVIIKAIGYKEHT